RLLDCATRRHGRGFTLCFHLCDLGRPFSRTSAYSGFSFGLRKRRRESDRSFLLGVPVSFGFLSLDKFQLFFHYFNPDRNPLSSDCFLHRGNQRLRRPPRLGGGGQVQPGFTPFRLVLLYSNFYSTNQGFPTRTLPACTGDLCE